ncbi:unnamed protein product [Polarella glacialis]|uniref:Uncharacterized protein n=1 Tax=Polarella glacialis TaxID=89957 RepID=A0A813FPE6_POLGL|nr:unnamed protein product [Polarella glacialis]
MVDKRRDSALQKCDVRLNFSLAAMGDRRHVRGNSYVRRIIESEGHYVAVSIGALDRKGREFDRRGTPGDNVLKSFGKGALAINANQHVSRVEELLSRISVPLVQPGNVEAEHTVEHSSHAYKQHPKTSWSTQLIRVSADLEKHDFRRVGLEELFRLVHCGPGSLSASSYAVYAHLRRSGRKLCGAPGEVVTTKGSDLQEGGIAAGWLLLDDESKESRPWQIDATSVAATSPSAVHIVSPNEPVLSSLAARNLLTGMPFAIMAIAASCGSPTFLELCQPVRPGSSRAPAAPAAAVGSSDSESDSLAEGRDRRPVAAASLKRAFCGYAAIRERVTQKHGLLSNFYAEMREAREANRGHVRKITTTAATRMQAEAVKKALTIEMNTTEPFKLSRFKNVSAKVTSYRDRPMTAGEDAVSEVFSERLMTPMA